MASYGELYGDKMTFRSALTESFHDHMLLGKRGEMIYVLDDNLNAVTPGGHELTWDGSNTVTERVGASETKRRVNKTSRDVTPLIRERDVISVEDVAERCEDPLLRAVAESIEHQNL